MRSTWQEFDQWQQDADAVGVNERESDVDYIIGLEFETEDDPEAVAEELMETMGSLSPAVSVAGSKLKVVGSLSVAARLTGFSVEEQSEALPPADEEVA